MCPERQLIDCLIKWVGIKLTSDKYTEISLLRQKKCRISKEVLVLNCIYAKKKIAVKNCFRNENSPVCSEQVSHYEQSSSGSLFS